MQVAGMAHAMLPVSVEDLHPQIPRIEGAHHYPVTGEHEVIFVVCSSVSGQLFTRKYQARQLIRDDISANLPDLRSQVFAAEARKFLIYVAEVEQSPSRAAFGMTPKEPYKYKGYKRAAARGDNPYPDWDATVDDYANEVEIMCRETPIRAYCPGFWPICDGSRILEAKDVVQVFEDAKAREKTHITFRLSFSPWSTDSDDDLEESTPERLGALPRSYSLPSINLTRMTDLTSGKRPALGPRSATSPAGLSSESKYASAGGESGTASLGTSHTVSGAPFGTASPLLRRALAVRRASRREAN